MNLRLLLLLLGLLVMSSCARPLDPRSDLQSDCKHFSEAMRWQDYVGASRHLHEDVREELMAIFQENEDLRVVESMISRVDFEPESDRAKVEYRMQYYLLPSMRVKKWQWLQEWELQTEKGIQQGLWLITNSPPKLN